MSSSFVDTGKVVFNHKAMATVGVIAPGTYVLALNMELGYHLVRTENYEINHKVYGRNSGIAERIWNTFCSKKRLGALLSGDKGSGKTLISKQVACMAVDNEIPVIIINTAFCGDGFNSYIHNDIQQQCMILFDEFEKVYDTEQQEKLLTLLDGTLTSDKLYMFTCNDLSKIQSHMLNRPGRMHYHYKFKGVTEDLIRHYCEENLNDKTQTDKVVLFSEQFRSFNFDLLQTVVSEMNLYSENVYEVSLHLNATPDDLYMSASFNILSLHIDGVDQTARCVDKMIQRPRVFQGGDMSVHYQSGKPKKLENHWAYFTPSTCDITLNDQGQFIIHEKTHNYVLVLEQAFKDDEKAKADYLKYLLTTDLNAKSNLESTEVITTVVSKEQSAVAPKVAAIVVS